MLDKEFTYYLEHQEELVSKYNGRSLVIREEKVVGDFDSNLDAYTWGYTHFPLGTFLIQKCSPGPKDYTVTFHSRVHFS